MEGMKSLLYTNIKSKVNISEPEFNKFMEFTKSKNIGKNEFLLMAGNVTKYLAFVLKGVFINYSVDSVGDKHVMQIAPANHWTTDLNSFFTGQKSAYFIESLAASQIVLLSYENFEKACIEVPVFERFFRLLFQNAFISALNRVTWMQSEPATGRYLKFLESKPEVYESVPQHLIASYLGIKPQSLSRLKKNLASKTY